MAEFTFRLVESGDLPLILKWLRDPEVARWYWDDAGLSDDQLIARFESDATGDALVHRYVIQVDGVSVGEIQTNRMADFPDHDSEIGIPAAAGVDIFIGDTKYRHRGLGAEIIRAFICDVIFEDPQIQTITIDPAPANTIAIRAYEKAGFHYVREYYSKAESVDVYLMRLDREGFSG